MKRRRILLFGVAGLLCVSALLAIAILLVGRFGGVQGRILGSTALLAAFGVLALPGVILLDQSRNRGLAYATQGTTALAAALALAAVWGAPGGDTFGKTAGTAALCAAALVQTAALAARRQERDPPLVRRLFAASCATAAVAVMGGTTMIWAQPTGSAYPRFFGALAVLDLLLVALQPVFARARPAAQEHRFAVTVADGRTIEVAVSGGDLATAAAKAIRSAERHGAHVVQLRVNDAAERTRS